jgi:hypothetical protein
VFSQTWVVLDPGLFSILGYTKQPRIGKQRYAENNSFLKRLSPPSILGCFVQPRIENNPGLEGTALLVESLRFTCK